MAKIRFLQSFGAAKLDPYFVGKDFIVKKVEDLDMFGSKPSHPTIKFETDDHKFNLSILLDSLQGNDAIYSDEDGYCMLFTVLSAVMIVQPAYYNIPRDHLTTVTVDFLNNGKFTYNNITENISTTYVGADWGTISTDYFSKITCIPNHISNGITTSVVTCADDTIDNVSETNKISAANKNELRERAEKLLENLDNKKENKNMRKINNNELKQIVINEKDKVVTAISEYHSIFGNKKEITLAKCHKDDEFDPYIGAALAIAYQLFGSKTQFHKYIDNEAKNVDKIKAKKEASKEKK